MNEETVMSIIVCCTDFTVIGPSLQQNIDLSADGIDTTVIFEAGSTSNSTNVLFNISDGEVALEPLESYDAALQSTTSVCLGSPGVTRVNILWMMIEVHKIIIHVCLHAESSSCYNGC